MWFAEQCSKLTSRASHFDSVLFIQPLRDMADGLTSERMPDQVHLVRLKFLLDTILLMGYLVHSDLRRCLILKCYSVDLRQDRIGS